MSNSLFPEDENFFNKYGIIPEKRITDKPGQRVYLVSDKRDHSKKVLKINFAFPLRLKRETDFLISASKEKLSALEIPQVFAQEYGILLTEFIDREYFTRETILEKKWNREEVELFLKALKEFQELKISSKGFKLIERIKGFAFPSFRLMDLYNRIKKNLSFTEKLSYFVMILRYLFIRLFIRNVNVHYDFQTTNFTTVKEESKMSLIDFQPGIYSGDSLYDLIYYLSVPVQKITEWNFQDEILRAWMHQNKNEKFLKTRMKIILLLCFAQRFCRFIDDEENRNIYLFNIHFLLKPENYLAWFARY